MEEYSRRRMKNNFISKSLIETKGVAESFAQEIIKSKDNRAKIIGFVGDLGAGKTTFIQSFIKALGVRKRILSPTFIILKRFNLPKKIAFKNVYHIDAYRVKAKDLFDLGIEKAISEKNIVLIEWADRVKSILPQDTIWIRFKHGRTENERKITINRR